MKIQFPDTTDQTFDGIKGQTRPLGALVGAIDMFIFGGLILSEAGFYTVVLGITGTLAASYLFLALLCKPSKKCLTSQNRLR